MRFFGFPTFYNVDNPATRDSIEVVYKYVRKWNVHKDYAGSGHSYPVNGEELYVVYEPIGAGWRELPAQGLISVRAVTPLFDRLSAFIPRRVDCEEIGDALDDIYRRQLTDWRLCLKVASTMLVVVFNAAREVVLGWLRRR